MNNLFIVSADGVLNGNIEELRKYKNSILEIPSEVNGIKVVRIDNDAFCLDLELYEEDDEYVSVLKDIKEIRIADGIKEIGENAFRNCESITDIIIPNSVEKLEESCFSCCYSVKNIKLSENIIHIPLFAFSSCYEISKVVIPDSVKAIDHCAFAFTGIKEIYLPETLEEIDYTAFDDCEELEEVILPEGVEITGYSEEEDGPFEEFANCEALVEYQ